MDGFGAGTDTYPPPTHSLNFLKIIPKIYLIPKKIPDPLPFVAGIRLGMVKSAEMVVRYTDQILMYIHIHTYI